MNTFKWKCPQCETINSDVTCENCGHMPEYYLPLDSVNLKPEKLKPIPDELSAQEEDWRCSACGMLNEGSRKKCFACQEPKAKKEQKKEKEKEKQTGVRGWLVMSVFLVAFLLILIVVVGKIVATTRPEIMSGDISSLFNVTPRIQSTSVPAESSTEVVVSRVYPNPPEDGCILWSDITQEYEGKSTCVYGLVYDTYIGEPTQFNIRFSDQKDTFRMVMTGMDALELKLKPPAITGECVYQTGEVKFYKSVPYISFIGMVLICEQ